MAPESSGSVVTVAGDILNFGETLLAHQCCCVLARPAQGVAAAIFEHFPAADVYRERRERGRPIDTPGHLSLHGRVVNLYGQFCPGRPLDAPEQVHRSAYAECFARFPGLADTRGERLEWFRQGLEALARTVPSCAPRTLALPARMGCGLAAGHWPSYLEAIRAFAARHNFLVAIYDVQASAGSRSQATGQIALACSPAPSQASRPAVAPAVGDGGKGRSNFWDEALFEVQIREGAWLAYAPGPQVLLRRAARQRSSADATPLQLEASGGAMVEVSLAGVELGRGRQHSAGSGEVAAVRLHPAAAAAGDVRLPAELERVSAPDLHACGRRMCGWEAASVGHDLEEASCAVCFCGFAEQPEECVWQLDCGHSFHDACLSRWFQERPECPTCKRRFGIVLGAQPLAGRMSWVVEAESLPGHPGCGTVALAFRFPAGADEQGVEYTGRQERAYLPDDARGRVLLALFRLAFRRRVLFGLGVSMELGIRRPTFNVHLKTSRRGGVTRHGFPDDDYYARAVEELQMNGVSLEQLA